MRTIQRSEKDPAQRWGPAGALAALNGAPMLTVATDLPAGAFAPVGGATVSTSLSVLDGQETSGVMGLIIPPDHTAGDPLSLYTMLNSPVAPCDAVVAPRPGAHLQFWLSRQGDHPADTCTSWVGSFGAELRY